MHEGVRPTCSLVFLLLPFEVSSTSRDGSRFLQLEEFQRWKPPRKNRLQKSERLESVGMKAGALTFPALIYSAGPEK